MGSSLPNLSLSPTLIFELMATTDISPKKMHSNKKKDAKLAPRLKLVKRKMAYNQIETLRPIRLNFDFDSDDEVKSTSLSVPSLTMYLEEIGKVAKTPAEIDYFCRNLPTPPSGFKYSDHLIFQDRKKA